ncbi:MAG: hypothetical protein N3D11_12050 [Candidatus Sumerlaeia bacterium]|nr:hypothetical protein [Candidatus Sumerlaeia bacterium]
MVRDINTKTSASSAWQYVGMDGVVYFTADDSWSGEELWKTDGTAAGTVLVQDIYPGEHSSSVNYLVGMNGMLYFSANDGIHGAELWKSNGSRSGTVLVKDVNPGVSDSSPEQLTVVGGVLFFVADDGSHGKEPAISWPTTARMALNYGKATARPPAPSLSRTLQPPPAPVRI